MKPIFTFLIILTSFSLNANNLVGGLKGMVADDLTGKPLAAVKIFVNEKETQTDNLGRFELNSIAIGNQTVIVEKQGFLSKIIPLSIAAGETEILSISLKINVLELPEVLIKSDRAISAASSLVVNALDFQLRPVNSAQDLLRNVSGLITAQHAGGGKAEQIFLRGFDADHGTDVAAFVDGMPVNMPSHGHGQGYLDLHFLIPETVKNAQVYKGTYFAELGDFATAGAVKFKTLDKLDRNLAQIELGSVPTQRGFASSRGLLMLQMRPLSKNCVSSYLASEYIFAPSYFESPQNFKRLNIFSKTIFDLNQNAKLSLSLSQFNSAWSASGQIPERAVESGQITRFGAIDNTEGGKTGRQNANLSYRYLMGNQSFEANTYVSKYNFELFSNFTFALADSLNGDMIRQRDDRTIAGFNTQYQRDFDKIQWSVGSGLRYDAIDNQLTNAPLRQVSELLADANINQSNAFIFSKINAQITPKLTAELGLRFNYSHFNVTDNLPTDANRINYSGKNQQSQIAPKLNLTYSFSESYKLFINAGKGFHSNDARAVVQNPTHKKLPNAWGSELGFQIRPLSKVVATAALWALEMENELIFVGDAGTTEDNGASRRIGLDLSLRAQMGKYFYFDADANWARGRLLEKNFGALLRGDNLIPLAPTFTATSGISARFPCGINGAFRLRHVSDRAANESKTVIAKGYSVVDANCYLEKKRWRIGFSIENLLNSNWNEAQFDTESRLKNEAVSVSELHFTAGTPFAVKAVFAVNF